MTPLLLLLVAPHVLPSPDPGPEPPRDADKRYAWVLSQAPVFTGPSSDVVAGLVEPGQRLEAHALGADYLEISDGSARRVLVGPAAAPLGWVSWHALVVEGDNDLFSDPLDGWALERTADYAGDGARERLRWATMQTREADGGLRTSGYLIYRGHPYYLAYKDVNGERKVSESFVRDLDGDGADEIVVVLRESEHGYFTRNVIDVLQPRAHGVRHLGRLTLRDPSGISPHRVSAAEIRERSIVFHNVITRPRFVGSGEGFFALQGVRWTFTLEDGKLRRSDEEVPLLTREEEPEQILSLVGFVDTRVRTRSGREIPVDELEAQWAFLPNALGAPGYINYVSERSLR